MQSSQSGARRPGGSRLSMEDGSGVGRGSAQPRFNMEKEPIFESILRNMVLGNAVNIKKKARIKVSDACVLIGIIDERGILEEGEVFIRICRSSYEIDNELDDLVRENLYSKDTDSKT